MKISYFAFARPEGAEKFIGALFDHKATQQDISVLAKEGAFGDDARKMVERVATGITTTTSQDAAAGASSGAAVGTGVGILAALACVFIPGVGLVLGGGALAVALAGALGAAGAGAIAGGVAGYMKDLGIPTETTAAIERLYEENSVIVAYHHSDVGIDPDTLWTLAQKYDALETPENVYGPFAPESVVVEAELEHVAAGNVTRFEPTTP